MSLQPRGRKAGERKVGAVLSAQRHPWLQGSLLGEVGALLLPCSCPAETKPRLARPQEEGSLGAQAGPERRLSGSFVSQGLGGTVTCWGGGRGCGLGIFSAASPASTSCPRASLGAGDSR